MRKVICTFLLFASGVSWAAYQPINGSSVTISPYNNTTLPVSGTVGITQPDALNVVSTSTVISGQVNNVVGFTVNLSTANQVNNINGFTVTAGSGTWSISQPDALNVVSSNTVVTGSSVTVYAVNGGALSVQGLLSDNGALPAANRVGTLPAILVSSRAANLDGTATTVGRNAALKQTTSGSLQVALQPDNGRYSYAASTNNWTLASTPSDITALCGNASNTVLVTRLSVSCTQTTAGIIQGSVLKYSTKFTGAWSTMTVTPLDSNYTAVQSTAVWFTANPVRGTEVGHLDDILFGVMAPGTASANDIYISPAFWRTNPVVLRGIAQCVAFNLEGVTATGGKCSAAWNWIEDPSL